MKLTIFSRLVIGYLAIFILAMAVSIYAIEQLRQLENVSRSIRKIDNRLLYYEQELSDVLMSLMRNEKKFIIIRDEGLYDRFTAAKADFEKNLEEVMTVADSELVRDLLDRVKQNYKRYQSLFEIEVGYLKAGQEYASANYSQEKELVINRIMDRLKELRTYSQNSTFEKINKFSEAEGNASKVAIVMGLISLFGGIIISIFITFNITKPLNAIKSKTNEIAKGNFGDDLQVSSPPEITELAVAINTMCTRLEATDKVKSDFFSLMSHELRTPLTTIKEGTNLMIEGLDRGKATEKQERLLTIISEESDRLINLVNSLMDLSKMEAGMMTYNFTRSNVSNLINQVAREIEPLAETKHIVIQTETDSRLPLIKIDRDRILQVLRNLIGNAVKFSPEQSAVKINSDAREQEVNISVSDSGGGIPEESLSTIFDKYEQVIHEGSNKIKGTGLGLSIVKHVIDAHGGKIWVESTMGQGSVFKFVLPV